MALSRSFLWVEVDRDATPEIPKRFSVRAYPSLLVLGPGEVNVHRWSAFQEPGPFLAEMKEALRRWELLQAGRDDWDALPPAPPLLDGDWEVADLPAPSDAVPAGMAFLGPDLWVAHLYERLYRLDPASGEIRDAYPLPRGVTDLCTDGKVLYGVTSSWTAGGPIFVIDPVNGEVLREIVTEANKANRAHGARGIAWHEGSLWVLEGSAGRLRQVDPATGEIGATRNLAVTWVSGLDCDGQRFLTGGREAFHLFEAGAASDQVLRSVAVNHGLRSVAFAGDGFLLMQQPVWGFDREHKRIQIQPRPGATSIHRVLPKRSPAEDIGPDRG